MNAATRDAHTRSMAQLRAYVSGGMCRHAALVNHFQPGALPSEGPCQGGCDNCARRAAAAASGTGGGETDVTVPARLLIAAAQGLRVRHLSSTATRMNSNPLFFY
jgi:superfamily II DNA helicase RecQ